MSDMMAEVIASRVATLHELKTVYDSEDLLMLWEAHAVTKFNESILTYGNRD